MTALVSVLVPCFNAKAWIAETLDSALAQTWPNLEIIVVDDGSTDASAAVVQGYGDRRVQLIRQANLGPSAARNRALSACRGDFVQYLDADDILEPEKIERQVERLLGQPDCIALGATGRFTRSADQGGFRPDETRKDFDPFELLLGEHPGGSTKPPSWMIPRPISDTAGRWDERLHCAEDFEYFTRLVLAAKRVFFCPEAKWMYRTGNPNSLSLSPDLPSLFLAYELAAEHMIARADSACVRKHWALRFQNLARWAYPMRPDLAEGALRRAAALHPVKFDPGGGIRFRLLRRLIGWRAARNIQFKVLGK